VPGVVEDVVALAAHDDRQRLALEAAEVREVAPQVAPRRILEIRTGQIRTGQIRNCPIIGFARAQWAPHA
jgi:hypothetical protein